MTRKTPYWLWATLELPALGFSYEAATATDLRVIEGLLHPTGEMSARLLIITMLASPLALAFRGWRGPAWLKRNRRYLGVASFGYAALHTLFYLIETGTLSQILGQVPQVEIWSGWIAFAIFVPLALTSMDAAQRIMGRHWKTLQRATYPAAAATLLHWAALEDWAHPAAALTHFGPLVLLEAYRVWYWYLRPRPRALA